MKINCVYKELWPISKLKPNLKNPNNHTNKQIKLLANIIKYQGQHAWKKLADYVTSQEQEGDKILLPTFVYQLPFEHYYQGKLEVVGYEPKGLEENLLLKAVKYNWYPVINENNMPDINQILENKKRVIIVYPRRSELIHNSNLVLDWFVENNWQLIQKKEFSGFVQPNVFIFQRPE